MSDENKFNLSRRRLLGAAGTIGAAGALGGAATTSLFWDEEVFGNSTNPNELQAGRLDLKVDYEMEYFNGNGVVPTGDTARIVSGAGVNPTGTPTPAEIDQPTDNGLLIRLTDLKPGDAFEKTISLHLYDNPGFIYSNAAIFKDSDNGFTEPEDKSNDDMQNGDDGTADGDLDDHLQCLIWLDGYDDADQGASSGAGDNFPNEITSGHQAGEAFYEDLAMGNVTFDDSDEQFIAMGSFRDVVDGSANVDTGPGVPDPFPGLTGDGLLLDPRLYGAASGDEVAADEFGGYCFADSTTVYVGILCWLPWDIPGVDDNIIQTDQVEYGFAFNAIQCRHNMNGNRPASRSIDDADAESNNQGLDSTPS